ncbi:PSD1 and planctomycete cytochrome C domain-containing protein [Calycomorphotria hydatis]|uniref:Planctomycete cytochrome C n=1 Tax=Calycomorphotria hydatis TaxID=2528027 RepID=A0A517T9T9_9PLAN|nr:PSD1 and planctomycete cytochrome C domain-containing protein [Calycomorphotria hydatis]QDT65141.1 Planctomycete cytochrome C [Calycomorphotria hydatis]
MFFRVSIIFHLCFFAFAGVNLAIAQEQISFGREIKPILARHCFACHGPDVSESGLRLDEAESTLRAADSGEKAVLAGLPEESELIRRISSTDSFERMPPEGKGLSDEEIVLLKNWITQGAKWEKHWAFEPVKQPAIPQAQPASWVRNPIDAFVLRKLNANSLSSVAPATKSVLIRRLYFDLIGLPPSPEEVNDFINDTSPDAYERLVDHLLASPHYGERWARHWLDVVRYAETNSFERDGKKPNAWKYRDYVIRSFNEDKPYDQFLREQLAGDEIDHVTAETITATGFYRLGIWDDEPADKLQARFDEFDDIITTIGQGMLGLTFNCARCHDHKIDPLPQSDYYGLLAFISDIPSYGRRKQLTKFNQTDVSPVEIKNAYENIDSKALVIRASMRKIEQLGISKMDGPDQRIAEGNGRSKLLAKKLRLYVSDDDWGAHQQLKHKLEQLNQKKNELPPQDLRLSVTQCNPSPPPTHILARGNPHSPTDQVLPHYPEVLGGEQPHIPALSSEAKSAGRRRVFAEWVTSPGNPLTARVMVNRIWQHHFGRGLVRSSNNFGQAGTPPTHPELLDWLAIEFMSNGWKLKPIHRMIALSSAYQASSKFQSDNYAADPENDFFWRFDIRRLSAEEIRDAVHVVNGRFNSKMYGPSYFPDLSKEVLQGQSKPGSGWGKSPLDEQARRSIYIFIKRSLIPPSLSTFDFPETDQSCEARFNTTQPGQALNQLNGEFLHRESTFFARRLLHDCDRDNLNDIIRNSYQLAFSRSPADEELNSENAFIGKLMEDHALDLDRSLELYCLSLFNRNEFIYLD